MRPELPSVVYVLPDKLGGVFNFVANLLGNRRPDGLGYRAVLTRNRDALDTRSSGPIGADGQRVVEYSDEENIYSYLRKLRNAVGDDEGVLVANDWIELAMVSAYPTRRMVVNITHADTDYYYDLATIHEPFIDCFVTYARQMELGLRERLPHRRDSIFRIPYGVTIPSHSRTPANERLRLLYVGRLDRQKGVFDLPRIDALLSEAGCLVTWTIQGAGPHEAELRRQWQPKSPVEWRGERTTEEVLALYPLHDILIMPSRSEGLPVALLEAGAAGVVPVASNLASGIPEVVKEGVTGFMRPVGDVHGFAAAVVTLDSNRPLLQSMSRAVSQLVSKEFNARNRAPEYQDLYSRRVELRKRQRPAPSLYYGSRLDQPWLPNALVTGLRAFRGRRK